MAAVFLPSSPCDGLLAWVLPFPTVEPRRPQILKRNPKIPVTADDHIIVVLARRVNAGSRHHVDKRGSAVANIHRLLGVKVPTHALIAVQLRLVLGRDQPQPAWRHLPGLDLNIGNAAENQPRVLQPDNDWAAMLVDHRPCPRATLAHAAHVKVAAVGQVKPRPAVCLYFPFHKTLLVLLQYRPAAA